jgi:uncharacterized membrane protein (UPF0127 family)
VDQDCRRHLAAVASLAEATPVAATAAQVDLAAFLVAQAVGLVFRQTLFPPEKVMILAMSMTEKTW